MIESEHLGLDPWLMPTPTPGLANLERLLIAEDTLRGRGYPK